MEPYHDLLARIHNEFRPSTYIEIGVSAGWSMGRTHPDTICVGIDPWPEQIADDANFHSNVTIYPITSDEFFDGDSVADAMQNLPIELAFIDGMHQFEYALRDFIGIEKWSCPGSVVLVHDCLPVDEITAARDRVTAFWSGDIWRLILILKKYRPDLTVTTLDIAPTGLGVIRGLDRDNTVLQDNYDAIVAEFLDLPYGVLDAGKRKLLNVTPSDWSSVLVAMGVSIKATPNYVMIPFLDKVEMTENLVRQIAGQGETRRIYLMDNSPQPRQGPWPWSDLENVDTHFCPEWNLHRMWNFGIHLAMIDALNVIGTESETLPLVNVGIFNNDLIIDTKNFISNLASALRSNPFIGMVAATVGLHPQDAPRAIPATYATGLHGACVMVRAELPIRFDDRYEWYYGDSDFQAQIANAGYTNCVVPNAKYTHIDGGHVSLREVDRDDFAKKVARDEFRFYRKWPQIPKGEYWIPEELLHIRK